MDTTLKTHKLHDLGHLGLRLVVGAVFIVHSLSKFNSGFVGFLQNLGIPGGMGPLIGCLEMICGMLIIVGILSRVASALLVIDMLGAIIYVKKIQSFSGKNGIELELLILVILLMILIYGPGRISISQAIKKIPRFLQ